MGVPWLSLDLLWVANACATLSYRSFPVENYGGWMMRVDLFVKRVTCERCRFQIDGRGKRMKTDERKGAV